MLSVYNDLNEVIELLLSHFDTFVPAQNDTNEDQYTIDIPEIPIRFVLLDNDITITVNRKKYVFAIAGNYLSGYMPQSWIKRSPIFVYPVYYDGFYVDEFYLTKKEMQKRGREIHEACKEV